MRYNLIELDMEAVGRQSMANATSKHIGWSEEIARAGMG